MPSIIRCWISGLPREHLPLICRSSAACRISVFGRRPGAFSSRLKAGSDNTGALTSWLRVEDTRCSFPADGSIPSKFLLRHYPIRSQEHGRRKILVERIGRLNSFDREIRGWHKHLEPLAGRGSFVWDPGELLYFDDTSFYREYVVERLTGVGIVS